MKIRDLVRGWFRLANRGGRFLELSTRWSVRQAGTTSALGLPGSSRSRWSGLLCTEGLTPGTFLPFQDPCPIELNIRVVLLDEADGILVERGSPDAHTRRRAEPIEDPRTRLSASAASGAVRVHDKRVLVTAFIARKPQVRQIYFLFCVRVAVLRADVFERAAEALRPTGLARRGAAERDRVVGTGGAFGAGARRGSGAARCTIVNRV